MASTDVERAVRGPGPAAGAAGEAPLQRLPVTHPDWAAFVARSPAATPFHDPSWASLLAETYGLEAFALTARGADGAVTGGAPFLQARTMTGHRVWISLPYTDECHPLTAEP